MKRLMEGQTHKQITLLPECLDDFIKEDNTVRIDDAFIKVLDLAALEFQGLQPASTGRSSYHPSVLLNMAMRKRTVEHIFGTLKQWMSWLHFLIRGIQNVVAEMSLNVLAYNFKCVLCILGFEKIRKAMHFLGA